MRASLLYQADAFAKLQKLLIIARVVMEKHVENEEKWGGDWGFVFNS